MRTFTGPPRRRLPRVVREQQMLDAAVVVFSRNGYHLASMDEIAEVAGVSKPMIYAYLGSKEDLFTACIRREAERLMEAVAAAVVEGLRPDEQLWAGLLSFFEFVAHHRDGWTVLYRQARVQGGPFAAQIQQMRERATLVVAGLLTGSHDSRRDRATPLAHALVGAAESLSDWGMEHPEETPASLAHRMMDFAWTGLGGLARGERWGVV